MSIKAIHIFSILLFGFFLKSASAQFQYISPMPGSSLHHCETNIIIRNGDIIDKTSLEKEGLFTVSGSLSSHHDVSVVLSDDGKTVLLQPSVIFDEGETVTVTVSDDMRTSSGKKINGTSFVFHTIAPQTLFMKQELKDARRDVYEQEFGPLEKNHDNTTRGIKPWKGGLPVFSIWKNTNPAPGDIFFHNFNFGTDPTAHYCIIKNNGDSVYGKYNQVKGIGFTLNHNNYITMYNTPLSRFEVFDSNYLLIEKYYCGNGYLADVHEFQLMPDGHSFLIAYDPQLFDMTVYDTSYSEMAVVIGAIVQELDANHNVVFQWRSWDHFEVTDATHIPFTTQQIDYVHANSIELDTDGNILLSCRHMEEVDKISLTTGEVLWRLGGKHNDFQFVDDPDKFSYQHDVRRLPNGHITMMDNGNYHVPSKSFAKEYALDEVNKVATLYWKYQRNVVGFSTAMGSVQRLPNGNTFICWGLAYSSTFPTITEVDSNKKIVWEMDLDPEFDDGMYRAHRISWTPCSRPSEANLISSNITQTSAKLNWGSATNANSYELQYKKTNSSIWTTVPVSGSNITLNGLTAGTKYSWKVRSLCSLPNPPNSGFSVTSKFTTLPPRLQENDILELQIYPNPAHDVVNVKFNLSEEESMTVQIRDIFGRLYYKNVVPENSDGLLLSIPVTELAAGMYLVEVISGNKKMIEKLTLQ